MEIMPSNANDVDEILSLYSIATEYMKSKNQVAWPVFEKAMVLKDITLDYQWKLVINNNTAAIWTIALEDEVIWGKDNKEPSVYLHRIATSPDFRGRNLVGEIVKWADEYCRKNDLRYIRMDTVGYNKGLINHYKKLGFEFLGAKPLENSNGLPDHYSQGEVCYFQREVVKER